MEESKRIDDYLSGRLKPEQQQAFEEELSRNPELKKQLELQRDMEFLLRHDEERAALKAVLEAEGAEHFRAEAPPKQRGRLRWIGWATAAAAAAILLFVLWPVFVQPDLYQEYAEFPPLALSEKSTTTTNWAATEQAFNTGNYEQADAQLEEYLKAFPEDQQARLYLGIAKMETGEPEAARRLFAEVSAAAPGLADYADWYRALSFLKTGDSAAAESLLRKIETGSPFYEQAQEVLSAL